MRTDKPRFGIPTASNFHHIITQKGQMVDSRERKKYIYKLTAERIFEMALPDDFRGNEDTEYGIEHEEEAAQSFCKRTGAVLRGNQAPFIVEQKGRWGCTPDRLIFGRNEAVEIKCPARHWTHIGYIAEGPGDKYKPQVQGQLMICGFDIVHFWAWHPKLPAVHVRTKADLRFQNALREMLERFCDEVDATETKVRRYGNTEVLEFESN
jgi:hypothetical protein